MICACSVSTDEDFSAILQHQMTRVPSPCNMQRKVCSLKP